jgi:hypothetical protein
MGYKLGALIYTITTEVESFNFDFADEFLEKE